LLKNDAKISERGVITGNQLFSAFIPSVFNPWDPGENFPVSKEVWKLGKHKTCGNKIYQKICLKPSFTKN